MVFQAWYTPHDERCQAVSAMQRQLARARLENSQGHARHPPRSVRIVGSGCEGGLPQVVSFRPGSDDPAVVSDACGPGEAVGDPPALGGDLPGACHAGQSPGRPYAEGQTFTWRKPNGATEIRHAR